MDDIEEVFSPEDEIEEEGLKSITRGRFLEKIESAINGINLVKLTFLANSAQKWGCSITMNAIIKRLCHCPTLKGQCKSFYTVKVKQWL
jgi:hypothetical protein